MPKETFFNLSEEKRQLIENTAITEFAAYGFDKASINTIVKNSGIAKGSFYQYFTEKKDLFVHLLVNVAAGKKFEYLSPVLKNPEAHDFFTVIKESFLSGLRFAAENPELEKMGSWVMNNTHHPIYTAMIKESGSVASNIYKDLLSKAYARGEFREGIDIDYIAYIFPCLLTGTMDYCMKNTAEAKIAKLSDIGDDLMEKVDSMMDFIRDGLGNKQSHKE